MKKVKYLQLWEQLQFGQEWEIQNGGNAVKFYLLFLAVNNRK